MICDLYMLQSTYPRWGRPATDSSDSFRGERSRSATFLRRTPLTAWAHARTSAPCFRDVPPSLFRSPWWMGTVEDCVCWEMPATTRLQMALSISIALPDGIFVARSSVPEVFLCSDLQLDIDRHCHSIVSAKCQYSYLLRWVFSKIVIHLFQLIFSNNTYFVECKMRISVFSTLF